MVELVDTRDLKSLGQRWLYGFESRSRHVFHIFHAMKKILFLLTLVLLAGCGTRSGHFKIEGRFLHFNQGEIYVYSPDGGISGLDTIKVQDGRFAYETPMTKQSTLVLVFPNFSEQSVFAESGEGVEVKADASHLKEMEISGTDDNKLMTRFREQIARLSPPEEEKAAVGFVNDHPESAVSVWLVYKYFFKTPSPRYKEAASLLKPLLAKQPHNTLLARMRRAVQAMSHGEKGSPLPHFTATATNGSTLSDVSLRAPMLAICVWATWEYRSQDMLRQLLSARDRSNGQLKVIGISVDASPDICRTYLKNYNMDCTTICDGQMLDGQMLHLLGVGTVPDVLIYKNGRLAERSMSLNALSDYLRKCYP